MTLFSRIFNKKPGADEPVASDRGALSDPARLQAAVERSEQERIAEILAMPDGQELRRLAGLLEASSPAPAEVPDTLERAARQRLSALVDAGTLAFPELTDRPEQLPAWLAIAAGCQDASHLSLALANQDEKARANLVLTGAPSRVRQLAAQSIDTPELLHALIKDVRNKDKSVYRILKQKTDALLAESRAAADRASAALALCESIERHGQRTPDSTYATTFQDLERRWQELALNSPEDLTELSARVTQAAAQCQAAVETQQQQAADEAARHAADALARAAAAQAAAEARAQAEEAASAAAAEAARAEEAAKSALAAEHAAETARREQAQSALREIEALVRKADEALASGATQRAAGLRSTIEEKLSAQESIPPSLARQVQQLDALLRELKHWKEYAVAPKRAELIAAMESLVGSSESPQALAQSIKALQQEWKTASKGIDTDMSGEAARFQRASQAAYQPCREWFEKQSQERQANLAQRQDIVARLKAFDSTVGGESVDWRLVAQVLREAPQEWRRFYQVDREPGRQVQQEFNVALRTLQAKLDAWHETNIADKQRLITRAQHLLTLADHRAAIDSVKNLQTEWKSIGPAPRDQEQRLWTDFRQACDAVFQKSDKVRADANAAVEAQRLSAQALCEEAERVAGDPAIAPSAAVTKVSELSAAFDALPELPAGIARGLATRMAQVLETCRRRVSQQRVKESEQGVLDLLEAHRRINAFGWGVLQRVDGADLSPLKEQVDSFLATVVRWPTGGLQATQQSLARAGREAGADASLNERALRTLCVRGEILSESTTPPEDEALRRELQMKRLMQSMGQGDAAASSDWEALVLEWTAAAAVSPELYDQLHTRFLQARAKRIVPSAPAINPAAFRTGRAESRGGTRPGDSDRGGRRSGKRY